MTGNSSIDNTLDAALDFLALGLDPEKCHFWVQSDVPEVTELTWILGCHTSLGLLERSHSYKDKLARGLTASCGLFTYPVLMAADILLYQAEIIPVGKDQKQHIEITRDIAERFNLVYGDVFRIPEPLISEDIAVIPGTDGQKMSKSYGNTINIFEDEKSLKKKVMRIVTDSTPVESPKDPEKCNLFALYRLFADGDREHSMRERYLKGGIGYGEVKKELFGDDISSSLAPFRARRAELAGDPGAIREILRKGSRKNEEGCGGNPRYGEGKNRPSLPLKYIALLPGVSTVIQRFMYFARNSSSDRIVRYLSILAMLKIRLILSFRL